MMALLADVAEQSVFVFFLILFCVQMLAHEIGYRLGRRKRIQQARVDAAGVVVGGMLGLLAFVLALTLSFANNRFTERRMGTLAEANAIGTAWLRAAAVGGPRGEAIARLLEDYAKVRAGFVLASREPAELTRLNQRTQALQGEMWGHLSAIVREQPSPVTSALMTSLNETFDASTNARFAYAMLLPPQLFWLLIGMTLVSMGCLGYQFGLKGRASRMLVALLTLMWTSIIVDILDLGSSRLGAIRTGAVVYEWTMEGFKDGLSIPLLPAGR